MAYLKALAVLCEASFDEDLHSGSVSVLPALLRHIKSKKQQINEAAPLPANQSRAAPRPLLAGGTNLLSWRMEENTPLKGIFKHIWNP